MRVVSGRLNKVIFCEGENNSLDFNLLTRLISDRITIVPAGSKFTFSVFIKGYFYSSEENSKYIIFRDRDFDCKPTENITLLSLGTRIFLTHRACIENYLLDANLIDIYWQAKYNEKLENPVSKWGHGNSPGVQVISAWIEEAAKSLQDYQAVRWSLADLLNMSETRSQMKTTWTGGSGKLPQSLAFEDCKNAALTLISEFKNAVSNVTQERFETKLFEYQQQFNQEDFWTGKQYLIWFHGKDIQKVMQQLNNQYISLKDCFDWLLNSSDVNQTLNFIDSHPDLIELRNRIEQL